MLPKIEKAPRVRVPKPLPRTDFVRLCMSAGGMTPELLATAKKEPQLEALWIMLEMSDQVHKDAPEVPAGLAALEGLNFLPTGAQAVLDAWPLL